MKRIFILVVLVFSWLFSVYSDEAFVASVKRRSALDTPHKLTFFRVEGVRPMNTSELAVFQELYNKGEFVTGRYSFLSSESKFNGKVKSYGVRTHSGWIRFDDELYTRPLLVCYNPFTHVLYLSDDDYDDYGNGLVVTNIPGKLILYQGWDEDCPIWLDANCEAFRNSLANKKSELKIEVHHTGVGAAFVMNYLAPFLYANFPSNLEVSCEGLLSNESESKCLLKKDEVLLEANGEKQVFNLDSIVTWSFFETLTNMINESATTL